MSKQDNVLNGKLADYAFFPLSHIFRDSKELPVRAVEVALQCLLLLICNGWRALISPELGKQLLILLAFLAGGSPVEADSKNVNEELSTAAFQCVAALFKFTGNAGLGIKGSIETVNIPILGHAVTVILEGINNGPALGVQISALDALASTINGITDEGAIRNFFPGIVSSLAKLLRPKSSSATSYRVLVSSIQILETVLLKGISDQVSCKTEGAARESNPIRDNANRKMDPWAQASSSQVKLALANVIPLRYHERYEVQVPLFQLCVSIVQRCRNSLSQSIAMIIETLIALCGQKHFADAPENMRTTRNLFIADPELLEMLKSSLHDWIIALPRIMQSNDDGPKKKSIDRISVAFQMVSSQDATSDILIDALALNLRTSISVAVQASSSQMVHPFSGESLEVTKMLQSSDLSESSTFFSPVLFNESSQKGVLNGLETLVRQLRPLPMSKNLQQGIIDAIRTTSGDEQLASLWLSLQLLRNGGPEQYDIDQYLHLPIESVEEPLLNDIYSFSLDVLSKPTFEENISWRMQALSLEVIALQASRQKEDFRPELVDALYPILERLGSPNAALQHHAITSLNLVSQACNYPNPSALIVANADYLVNAVALKLNTFEISPQAPLVLVMMVKLCGPALIPYLDDLVESIFAILACFHGYPRLVESLFAVLHAIVEESGKSPIPAILPPSAPTTRQPIYKPIDLASIAARLRDLKRPPSPSSPSHPPTPTPPQPNEDPPLPPPTKLLLTIALQTQNHLNSPSQPLLLSLLSLLTTAFPPLTPYPTHLLPLLATTFPLLLPALHSPSPQTCIAACAALSAACTTGGDFLASRIDDEWDSLAELCARRRREMLSEEKALGRDDGRGGGVRGMKRRAWDALTGFLVTVVQSVGVRAEREDTLFEILASELHRPAVRACLVDLNPDALWLVEESRDRVGVERRLVPPVIEGWTLNVVEF